MIDSEPGQDRTRIDRIIALVGAALHECDDLGLVFAAIDLSSALDKLAGHQQKVDER